MGLIFYANIYKFAQGEWDILQNIVDHLRIAQDCTSRKHGG